MKFEGQQPNISNTANLESKKSSSLFTKDELNKFKNLSEKEQKKQQEERLQKLEELQNKFRSAVEEATKTGKVEEAQKLKTAFDKDAEELKQLIKATEIWENAFSMEIIPDKEINSAKTAIKKLKAKGHIVQDYAKDMLTKVDWKEKLKDSYEIISISVGELFGDTKVHTYADIKSKAIENGLELVPAKLAPSIRLNYEKNGEWTPIAMEAIRERDGYLALFDCTDSDSGSSLLGNYDASDDDVWYSNMRFFFVRE